MWTKCLLWRSKYSSFNSHHWFTDGSVVILLRIVPEKQIQFRSRLSQLQFNLQRLCLFYPVNKWPATWGGLLGFISLPRHRVSWVSLWCPMSTGMVIFQCWASWSNDVFQYFLPPANEVWGKVMFSQACVRHSVHRGCASRSGCLCVPSPRLSPWTHPRHTHPDTPLDTSTTPGEQAGGTHPTWNAFLFQIQ